LLDKQKQLTYSYSNSQGVSPCCSLKTEFEDQEKAHRPEVGDTFPFLSFSEKELLSETGSYPDGKNPNLSGTLCQRVVCLMGS
jgi:hypothetical protein